MSAEGVPEEGHDNWEEFLHGDIHMDRGPGSGGEDSDAEGPGQREDPSMVFNARLLRWEGGPKIDMSGFEDHAEDIAWPASTPVVSKAPLVARPLQRSSGAQPERLQLGQSERQHFMSCERDHKAAMEVFLGSLTFQRIEQNHRDWWKGLTQLDTS